MFIYVNANIILFLVNIVLAINFLFHVSLYKIKLIVFYGFGKNMEMVWRE